MKTHYIGRFSIAAPPEMRIAVRTAALRYVEIDEIVWPKDVNHEQARNTEWDNFMVKINQLIPPDGTDKVIVRTQNFPGVGQYTKGVLYHKEGDASDEATWSILMDSGSVGVWFKGRSVILDKENLNKKMLKNIETSAKSYTFTEQGKQNTLPHGDWFYLEHGAINRPYRSQEESYIRFEGHPLDLVLHIKMEMDVGYYRETWGLIDKTKELLTDAALRPGISISKIRLGKREVAGMKGEESILRIWEHGENTLQFTWEFNGKEDSGEYPTTTIEMESPDGKLDEKIRIWDAVLDSMKPMFERKK